MSASLVGSEMCIRDSAVHACSRIKRPGRGLSGGTGGSSPEGPQRFQPVSYTHLTLPTICSV
eukprot:1753747-Alexandrium_andersonii.AAC.1